MDRRAETDFGIPVSDLMERAGLAVFQEIVRLLPEGGRVTFACGKGNNGGDGFVAARIAHENGYHADCLVACGEPDLAGEPLLQMASAKASGVPILFAEQPKYRRRLECLGCRDLVVDALLGTGAKCEVKGYIRDAIISINKSGVPVLSVDVPSGIDCDTGEELGESIWALKTVTLGLPKPYLFQGTGLEHAGYWDVADIGFPDSLLFEPTEARLIDVQCVGNTIPDRLRASHKGENGHVLIVAGSRQMPGAAAMCAKAAIRAGAGLVTVATTAYVSQIVASQVPECIFLILPEENGAVSEDAALLLLENQAKYHSTVFGPGLTHQQSVLRLLESVWKSWTIPCVIDADALNAVSKGVELPQADCVLTPHPGEMSRLLEASTAEIQADRFLAVAQAVAKFGKCALLKGPYSIVGDPDHPLIVNQTGNPGMASGGMGDVLSGVMAALLGQSVPSYYAASAAMYWHGLAGDLCAEEIGAIGYSASDLANLLPKARAKIVASCDHDTCSSC